MMPPATASNGCRAGVTLRSRSRDLGRAAGPARNPAGGDRHFPSPGPYGTFGTRGTFFPGGTDATEARRATRRIESAGARERAPAVEGVRRHVGHADAPARDRRVDRDAQAQGGAMTMTRTRGLGSVYQRGDTWWIKFYVDGKAKRETSGSDKQSVAVRLLKRRLEELSAGRYVPDAGKVTVADLLTMLAADATAKGNRSRPKLKHLCTAFDVTVTKAADGTTTYSGGWRALAITTDRVRAYEADRLQARAARATGNQKLAAFRRAVTLAV